jgi:hypothetical protein
MDVHVQSNYSLRGTQGYICTSLIMLFNIMLLPKTFNTIHEMILFDALNLRQRHEAGHTKNSQRSNPGYDSLIQSNA